jgi:hypothetical protein
MHDIEEEREIVGRIVNSIASSRNLDPFPLYYPEKRARMRDIGTNSSINKIAWTIGTRNNIQSHKKLRSKLMSEDKEREIMGRIVQSILSYPRGFEPFPLYNT